MIAPVVTNLARTHGIIPEAGGMSRLVFLNVEPGGHLSVNHDLGAVPDRLAKDWLAKSEPTWRPDDAA